ncbi:MAG: hypothetical protein IPH03_03735 [Tetrasphaera sp.]|nr:hypothetical protein [Tetrasphaera sp.]
MATSKRASTTTSELSADERAAVKEAAAEAKRTKAGKNTEQDVLDAIAAMDDTDRAIAEGLHALVREVAPELVPRTWYGFPGIRQGWQGAPLLPVPGKFKTRYGHIGFQDTAQLDDGTMWPTAYAITAWNAATAKAVETLIRRAVG